MFSKVRWVIISLALLVVLGGIVFINRQYILQLAGKCLISENKLQYADAIFVLGGNSWDRGNHAALLYSKGWAPQIICLGGNIPGIFKAFGKSVSEAEVSKEVVLRHGISGEVVKALPKGTSTWEEAQAIKMFCESNQLDTVIIVSSLFHTKRVQMVFSKIFEDSSIEYMLHGAPSSDYSERFWWKSEAGLIMVNNEYIKYIYYLLKY